MDLLAETGAEDSVSIRAVASRVGVSAPAVYLHFADKQALLDAVCDQVFERLHEQLVAAAADAPHPFEALRRQGVAYVAFARANPEHYRIVMMRSPGDTAQDASLDIAAGAFGHLVTTVQECVAADVLRGDPVTLALQLWAAAHGIASLLLSKPGFPWPPVEELVDSTIRMAGLGLALGVRTTGWEDRPLAELVAALATVEKHATRH